jgi:hypothetical protein
MEKYTKRQILTAVKSTIIEGAALDIPADIVVGFIDKELATLDKQAAYRKNKKAQAEDPLLDAVRDSLTDEFEPVSEIAARIEMEGATLGKITYRLNALVKDGKAEKQSIKVEGSKRSVQGYRYI